MKKLVFLCVALLVAPAMAVVEFSGDGETTPGQCVISYAGTLAEDLPRGIAVKLTCTGDVMITGMVPDSVDPAFNCFLDYAYSNDPYELGQGDPFADPLGPGVGTLPAGEISLCMGVLDETENQLPGPQAADIITLTVSGGGTIIVEADTLRGPDSGVVGSELASNLPIEITIGGGGDPCMGVLSQAGYENQLALYMEYVGAGLDASCWCTPYQCDGDAAVDKNAFGWRVYTTDLTVMASSWKAKIGDANLNPCGDMAHDKNAFGWCVYTTDLGRLASNWKATEAMLPGDCPRQDGM